MSVRFHALAVVLAGGLALTACEAPPQATPAPSSDPEATGVAPLTPTGDPQIVAAQAPDDRLQAAAGVVRVDPVADGAAKLFGTAGGDPAMNGLNVHIGFFRSPADGWLVFGLGDVLDYTVLASSAGRVDLDLHESILNEATGEIGSRHRKVIVSWTVPAEGETPTSIMVTPAS